MPRPIRIPFTIPPGAQFGADRARGTRRHQGTDYHVPIGTPIYGTESGGKVTWRGYDHNGYGHYVQVAYPSGRTLDAHMIEASPIPVGSPVGVNTLLGHVGLTGNARWADPPGSHVHHERRKTNGLLVNPEAVYGLEPAGFDPIIIEEEQDTDMKIVKVEKGTIALVGAFVGYNFKNGEAFSYSAYEKAYGAETGFTEGQVAALVTDGQARYNKLVSDVAGAVAKQIPSGTSAVDYAALAAAVNDDAARRLAQ